MAMTANKGIFNLKEGNGGGALGTSPGQPRMVTGRCGQWVGKVAEVTPEQRNSQSTQLLTGCSFPFERRRSRRNPPFTCLPPLPDSQVIYRSLPKWESLDPFGDQGQQQLKVTNLRIRLLRHQPCPCQAKDLAAPHAPLPAQHFAIYDLIVKGSCSCNGHAEQCVPARGYQPIRERTNHVVRPPIAPL